MRERERERWTSEDRQGAGARERDRRNQCVCWGVTALLYLTNELVLTQRKSELILAPLDPGANTNAVWQLHIHWLPPSTPQLYSLTPMDGVWVCLCVCGCMCLCTLQLHHQHWHDQLCTGQSGWKFPVRQQFFFLYSSGVVSSGRRGMASVNSLS